MAKQQKAKEEPENKTISNEFWRRRSKHGRDKTFSGPEIFLEAAYEYFKFTDENPWYKSEAIKSGEKVGTIIKVPTQRPYTIVALCIFLDITFDTFHNYERNKGYEDFFVVFKHVRDVIENNQLEGATVGAYNANIIARKLGLSDKMDHTVNSGIKIEVFDQKQKDELDNEIGKID